MHVLLPPSLSTVNDVGVSSTSVPVVIIVTEAVYAAHAKDIDVVAASVKATLLRLANEDAGQEEIDGRLRAIVEELGR